MLSFVFYSHLKMSSERTKRRDFLALTLITKKKIIKEGREMKNDKQESVL